MGFFFEGGHALFSVYLLTPAYFGKYFDEVGRMNLWGELAMCTGVLAIFFLMPLAITTLPMMPKALGGWRWNRGQRVGYLALGLVAADLIALAWKGWLAPKGWNAGLPPISLLAFVAALLPLIVKRKFVEEKRKRESERNSE